MTSARSGHTATLLADGTVLVAGGSDATGALSSAERYDPLTDTWSPAPLVVMPRIGHTATLLASGLVLVGGGANAASGTMELYDPFSVQSGRAPAIVSVTALLQSGDALIVHGTGFNPENDA